MNDRFRQERGWEEPLIRAELDAIFGRMMLSRINVPGAIPFHAQHWHSNCSQFFFSLLPSPTTPFSLPPPPSFSSFLHFSASVSSLMMQWNCVELLLMLSLATSWSCFNLSLEREMLFFYITKLGLNGRTRRWLQIIVWYNNSQIPYTKLPSSETMIIAVRLCTLRRLTDTHLGRSLVVPLIPYIKLEGPIRLGKKDVIFAIKNNNYYIACSNILIVRHEIYLLIHSNSGSVIYIFHFCVTRAKQLFFKWPI